jgi:serine protease Do
MEGESMKPSFAVAKTVIISSLLTIFIIGGLAFSFRHQLINYLHTQLSKTTGESEVSAVTSPAANDALVSMIEKVNGAVVSVVVTKNVPTYERYLERFDPWGFFSVPRMRQNGTTEQEVGGGSGFIVSNDGMIVTNNHVVADTEAKYSIVLNTGTVYTVDVLAREPELDIAVIKINQPIKDPLTFVTFGNSDSLKLGQTVVAIGNALAEFQNSVSAGVVSGLSRTIVASDDFGRSEQLNQVIQTDAAINPGNSGGPLLNLNGEVVGVNVATSRGAENIGFALPASVVKQTVESVRQYGEVVRPYIGVRYVNVTPRLVKENSLPVDHGALVLQGQTDEELAVVPGSPADKAGIKENDIILSVDEQSLKDIDLATVLRTKAVGQEITLVVYSRGEEKIVTLKLEKTV